MDDYTDAVRELARSGITAKEAHRELASFGPMLSEIWDATLQQLVAATPKARARMLRLGILPAGISLTWRERLVYTWYRIAHRL